MSFHFLKQTYLTHVVQPISTVLSPLQTVCFSCLLSLALCLKQRPYYSQWIFTMAHCKVKGGQMSRNYQLMWMQDGLLACKQDGIYCFKDSDQERSQNGHCTVFNFPSEKLLYKNDDLVLVSIHKYR